MSGPHLAHAPCCNRASSCTLITLMQLLPKPRFICINSTGHIVADMEQPALHRGLDPEPWNPTVSLTYARPSLAQDMTRGDKRKRQDVVLDFGAT
jgi:hypothetical protein